MGFKTLSAPAVGYTRAEFGAIFQVYSQNVYTGLFRDFSFTEYGGKYYIAFREEAGKQPLVTIEKRRLGPDKCLFVATTPGYRAQYVEIARSEKILPFIDVLKRRLALMVSAREGRPVKNAHQGQA